MISLSSLVPYSCRRSALFGASVAIMLGVAPALVATPALADLRVGGNPNAVTIDAQNTPVREILAALGKTFDVHVQSTANLDKQITGTYEGSLSKVLIRILEGYNVIMKTGKEGIHVTVLGTKNAPGTAVVSPASTVADTVAQAVQPSLAGNNSEAPVSAASSNAAPPLIVLAEGSAPPVPAGAAPDAAPNPMPVQPSTVAPPTPTIGSAPVAFPIGKATSTLPAPSGSAANQMPAPLPGAGTGAPPVPK
jgi:hypothetical protein